METEHSESFKFFVHWCGAVEQTPYDGIKHSMQSHGTAYMAHTHHLLYKESPTINPLYVANVEWF